MYDDSGGLLQLDPPEYRFVIVDQNRGACVGTINRAVTLVCVDGYESNSDVLLLPIDEELMASLRELAEGMGR